MNCCKYSCSCAAVIIGIIVGVILGVLFALGYVSTQIFLWAFFAIGILGVFIAPLYAENSSAAENRCFCRLRPLYFISSIGAIIASAVGLIAAPAASVVAGAIIFGIATALVTMQIVTAVCLSNCLCSE